MKTCFVAGCSFTASKGMFRAPKDKNKYIQWRKAVGKGGNNGRLLQRYDFVCQNHFEEDEVYKGRNIGGELYPYSVWRLKKGTVPSLNLPTQKKRKPPKDRSMPAPDAQPIKNEDITIKQEEIMETEMVLVDDESLSTSVSQLLDPHEAPLPPNWRWLLASASQPIEDPIVRIAVKIVLENDEPIILKSVSFSGNQVFYKVKGSSVLSRSFLRSTFHSISDISDLINIFDASNVCVGCDIKYESVLLSSKNAVRAGYGWREKDCVRLLEKGTICFKCDQLNKSSQTKVEQQLVARKMKIGKKLVKKKSPTLPATATLTNSNPCQES